MYVVVVVAVEQIAVYLTNFVSWTRFSSFRFENYNKNIHGDHYFGRQLPDKQTAMEWYG